MNISDCKFLYDEYKKDIHQYILEDYPNESVMGINENKELVKLDNIHEDPQEFFRVDSKEFYDCDIVFLIHSHTVINGKGLTMPDGSWLDPRTPSKEDMQLQLGLDIPFAIVSTDGDECSDPIYFPDYDAPLLGIEYVNGAYDCWNLVMRFFKQEYGIHIEDYPRAAGHWFEDSNHKDIDVYKKYDQYGFVEVDIKNIKYGDLVMFQMKGSISHAGIYVGDDKFIHHINKRLSSTESLPRWRNRIWKVARHEELL